MSRNGVESKSMIEVEKKALLSQVAYDELNARLLGKGALDLGENNTASVFYVQENVGQIKVQHLVSKGEAKIAWKSGGLDGSESRQEIEVALDESQLEEANELISALLPHKTVYATEQRRHDYLLESVNVAVKWSADWGYHIEFDINVENPDKVDEALQKISVVANDLGVELLTPDEEVAFVQAAIKLRKARS